MRGGTIRLAGRILGIYLAFLIYFGGVFSIIWFNIPSRFNPFSLSFPVLLLSAGVVGLFGFSYSSIHWRNQTRKISASKPGPPLSNLRTKEEPFEGLMKTGSFAMGVVLLVFGIVEFFYGLLLYGEKNQGYQLAAFSNRSYNGPYVGFLTYAPEIIVVSSVCVFILGLWMLVYSKS